MKITVVAPVLLFASLIGKPSFAQTRPYQGRAANVTFLSEKQVASPRVWFLGQRSSRCDPAFENDTLMVKRENGVRGQFPFGEISTVGVEVGVPLEKLSGTLDVQPEVTVTVAAKTGNLKGTPISMYSVCVVLPLSEFAEA